MLQIRYLFNSEEELDTELAEVCLLGKPPYSLRCTRCSKTGQVCVLYAIISGMGCNQKAVYCEDCSRKDIRVRLDSPKRPDVQYSRRV